MTNVVSTLSSYLSFSNPGVKAFRDALSTSLNLVPTALRQHKTHKQPKTVRWDKCQHYDIMVLLLRQKKETRYIVMQICHQLATSKSFPTRNPPLQFTFALTHLLPAWVVSRCSAATQWTWIRAGGSALRNHGEAKWNAWSSNLATHPNINNNPSKSRAATF